ncbi:helix-turn-helix DNA-binding domain protein [Arthrobacter phage Abba]|uniref:Helix-turn-helix DNA-binding domain protein n=1 Tax=Arthrobacter phage Abba TaxID=2713256 RepID=A0A6G8R331_9CAUD|nr:replication initiation protein [Arthrobacter phage Abba]QIN94368.1 helix-turn-helix DNA-binding domain protein [Arthrobacter phage Abba]
MTFAKLHDRIWLDTDWLEMSHTAQWLYEAFISRKINRAGVADWRPKRLTGLSPTITVAGVEAAAEELAERRFVIIDEDTEEILVRSYIRNDELWKQHNLMVSAANAYTATASRLLRGVIVHELRRLKAEMPDLKVWTHELMADVLMRESIDPFVTDEQAERASQGFAEAPVDDPWPTTV